MQLNPAWISHCDYERNGKNKLNLQIYLITFKAQQYVSVAGEKWVEICSREEQLQYEYRRGYQVKLHSIYCEAQHYITVYDALTQSLAGSDPWSINSSILSHTATNQFHWRTNNKA